tara:strand:+ start:11837 stop:13084 length:1248 start_codon:yes stop_codon:yes gene_type:complete
MKSKLSLAALFAALLAASIASSVASAQSLTITNATLRTEKSTEDNVTIVIVDGKITALGKGAKAPAGARVIDGTGKVLTAGLIAAGTRLGLVEINAVGYTNEGSFNDAKPIHAAFQVTDGYNPNSIVIEVARNGGITSTVSIPRGGLIGGQSAWMTMAAGSVHDNTVDESAALHVTLGRNASAAGDGSRGHALQNLRALFDDAQHYGKNRSAYDRGQTRAYGAGHLDLQVLLSVLKGDMPMVVSVDRKSDIAAVLKLAKQYKIRVVLMGATEAWMLADELAAAKVPVMLNPKSNLPNSFDQVNVVDDAATRLVKAGVAVIISPLGDASSARTLRQLAGLAVAHGLTWEQAFAAITVAPAQVFGAKRGTLKLGEAADLVLWSGDPLELSSRAELIVIGGVEQSLENHQTLLRKRYR